MEELERGDDVTEGGACGGGVDEVNRGIKTREDLLEELVKEVRPRHQSGAIWCAGEAIDRVDRWRK